MLTVLLVTPELVVEYLWFGELGYAQVFWTIRGTQILLFVLVFALAGLYFGGNFYALVRNIPPLWASQWAEGGEAPEVGGKPLTRARLRRLAYVIAGILSLLFASGFSGRWNELLRFWHAGSYGQGDPVYGVDLAYHMLELPFLQAVQSGVVGLAFLGLLALVTGYVIAGQIGIQDGGFEADAGALRHLGANLILLLLGWAWGFYLDLYELLQEGGGAVYGAAESVARAYCAQTRAGAAGGNIAGAQAYVGDSAPVERRAGGLGLVGAAFGLGCVFGPAIGGLLAADAVVARADALLPAFVPATAYSLPSFAAAGMSFLAVTVGFAFLQGPTRTRSAAEGGGRRTTAIGQFRDALASAALRPLTVAYFVVAVAFAGVQVMFIPYVADAFGYDATAAALLLTYVGVLGAVNQGVLVGRLSRVVSSRTLVAAGSVVLAGGLAAIPATGLVDRVAADAALGGPEWLTLSLVALLAALAALSLGNALVNVSLATLVSSSADDAAQGAAFGVTQGASSLGRTVGPPLMAVLYTVAVASPFLIGALLLVPVAAAFRRRDE